MCIRDSCDGGEWVSGHEIGCVKRTGHGTEDLRGALRDSCNDAMMQMVRSIGPANFAKYSREYGFGQDVYKRQEKDP